MGASITFIKTTKEEFKELQQLRRKVEDLDDYETEQEEEEYEKTYEEFCEKIEKVTIDNIDCGYSQVQLLRCVMLASVESPLLWEYMDTHKRIFDLKEHWRVFGESVVLKGENDNLLQTAITGTFAYWFNDYDCLVSMLEFGTNLNIIGEKNKYTLKTNNELIKQIEDFAIGYHGRERVTNEKLREILSQSNGLFIS